MAYSQYSVNYSPISQLNISNQVGTTNSLLPVNAESFPLTPTLAQDRFIGVFWDIENVAVPKDVNSFDVVQAIRNKFYNGHTEYEFICVCDVNKEKPLTIKGLVDAQVTVAHVPSICKNAADIKLAQCLRRFVYLYQSRATVILISADINFMPDLSDARHRHKSTVILIHRSNVSGAMLSCVHSNFNLNILLDLKIEDDCNHICESDEKLTHIEVSNLPIFYHLLPKISSRLRQLCENCGGKLIKMCLPMALIRFSCHSDAQRALHRMDGQDVLGNKLKIRFVKNNQLEATQKTGINFSSDSDSPNNGNKYSRNRRCRSAGKHQKSHTKKKICPVEPNFKYINTVSNNKLLGRMSNKVYFGKQNHNVVSVDNQPESLSDGNLKTSKPSREMEFIKNENPEKAFELFYEVVLSPIDFKNHKWENLKELLLLRCNLFATIIDIRFVTKLSSIFLKMKTKTEANCLITNISSLPKLGKKRLQAKILDYSQLEARLISILQDCDNETSYVFNFLKTYKERFQCELTIEELKLCKNIIKVWKDNDGIKISLLKVKKENVSSDSSEDIESIENLVTVTKSSSSTINLENVEGCLVNMSLKILIPRVQSLLEDHGGSILMKDFSEAYRSSFECLKLSNCGVYLEYLISCVPNVKIVIDGSTKLISMLCSTEKEKKIKDDDKTVYLENEIVELVRNSSNSELNISNFEKCYAKVYCKKLNFASFGYRSSFHLLLAFDQIFQIIGNQPSLKIILSYKRQMLFFNEMLSDIVKCEKSRWFNEQDIQIEFEKKYNKKLDPKTYGVYYIHDLFNYFLDSTKFNVKLNKRKKLILSYRLNDEDKQKIEEFRKNTISCLKGNGGCICFSEFVAKYSKLFNLLKLSDFGCTKLTQLFDMIEKSVRIFKKDSSENNKFVILNIDDLKQLLYDCLSSSLKTNRIFLNSEFTFDSIGLSSDLILENHFNVCKLYKILPAYRFKLINTNDQLEVVESNKSVDVIGNYMLKILMTVLTCIESRMDAKLLVNLYFKFHPDENLFTDSDLYFILRNKVIYFEDKVKKAERCIGLASIYWLAKEIRDVLLTCPEYKLRLDLLEKKLISKKIKVFDLKRYSLSTLILSFPEVVVKTSNDMVELTDDFKLTTNISDLDLAASLLPKLNCYNYSINEKYLKSSRRLAANFSLDSDNRI